MKYSQLIGIAASLAIIGICYMPWVSIESINAVVTGMHTEKTNFGRPGLAHITFSIICLLLFATPRVWAKRTNVFIATINLAWAIRNYIILTTCQAGECPEKKLGLYLLLVAAVVIQVMTFFPKIALPGKK